MTPAPRPAIPLLKLLLLAALAVLVHGYHLGADDAAIYVPAIKKVADPSLYPFGAEFFLSHAHLSFFADLVGDSARLTRLPIDFVIFVWHAASVFLLLLAAGRLAGACFRDQAARWGGVILLAALLSVPVAGTALAIMDPYLTARSLSTPASLFAIACYLSNRRKEALAWLLFTALMHPQMSVYAAALLGCLALTRRLSRATDSAPAFGLAGIPFLFPFEAAHGPAREVLYSRTYFFLFRWEWYEWIGVFAPLGLLWWISSITPRGSTPAFRTLARALVPFGLLFTAAGVVVSIPAWLENYTRLQPMRAFHLVYVVFFVLIGGLVQEYILRRNLWRWLGLFLPLAAGMWFLQRSSFPASPHVEWPGVRSDNPWASAFLWIRGHTPKDAAFEPLVRLSRDSGFKRFIYASSSSVYGIKEVENVTEELPLEPLTDYSKYKALCEEILRGYQSPEFTTVTVRPATVCGYSPRLRLDLTVNILTSHAYHRGKITVFGGSQRRPNIHIADITDLYVDLLSRPEAAVAGQVWNAGYENHTVMEIAEIVRKVVGERVEIVTQPTDDLRSYHISSKKIERDLGFVPKHTIEDAVRDLVSAFDAGLVPNAMDDMHYYNIKMMQATNLT